jgi:predicted MFS family arabinose efflux permease
MPISQTESQAPLPLVGNASKWLPALFGTACGIVVANLYYTQPLAGLVSIALGLPKQNAGLLTTLPLIGYGAGLLTVVPLGDLVENRRLVLWLVALEALCLLLISVATQSTVFLTLGFFIGVTAAVVQVLVPYSSYLVAEEARGRTLGQVVSGLMLGIMLSRPVSSLIADMSSWRMVYRFSAVMMGIVFVATCAVLPRRQPAPHLTYIALLASLGRIFATTEVLRRRALYHACLFGSFSAFWTALPLWLTGPQYHMSQRGVAWIALAGVAGAIAPPIAARMAGKGLARTGTIAAMLLAAGAFLFSDLAGDSSSLSIAIVVAVAIMIDFATSANLVFGQRAIFLLGAELRSRLNGLYLATFFAGGAVSAAASGWIYVHFGWRGVTVFGALLPLLGMLYLATEPRSVSRSVAETH